MTTHLRSIGSLRALAASRRRGHLAGGSWSTIVDRDVARVAADLLVLSQADPERLAARSERVEHPVSKPVDLDGRRARGVRPAGSGPAAPRVRAS